MTIQDEIRTSDHKAGKDVANFDNGLSAEVGKLKDDAREFSRNSKAVIHDGADVTVDYLRDLGKSLKKTGRLTLEKAEVRIHEKPGQSIAIAFAAGMVASILFGRRGL